MNTPLCLAHVNAESGFSGGEVQVFLLLEGLGRLGHRNVLFCQPGSASAVEAARRGIDWRAVPMRGEIDLPAVLALRDGFRRARVDLVHLHTGRATWLGGLAAWAAHLPAITTRRMDRRVKAGWRTQLVYTRLVRAVVAISAGVAERLAEGGVPRQRTHVIFSAVDPAALRPAVDARATRAALGAAPETVVALTPAALIPRKGIDVLLEATARLVGRGVDLAVWIAGEGPERAALERQAQRLGLAERVRFLGERRDVADLLAAADVVVMPSRREGLGIAALEAMAAARPVIASAVGGLREAVVDGRTGILVPPDDPAALAEALARVVRDAALRARLGAAGPARIEEGFSAAQMVAAYAQLYRLVLDEWTATRHLPAGRA